MTNNISINIVIHTLKTNDQSIYNFYMLKSLVSIFKKFAVKAKVGRKVSKVHK